MRNQKTYWVLGAAMLAVGALAIPACSSDNGDDGGKNPAQDAAVDGHGKDGGAGGSVGDAALDTEVDGGTGASDAGPVDSGKDTGPVDSGKDTGPVDSGTDSGPVDAGTDAGALVTVNTWKIETVDKQGDVGEYASLGFDQAAHPMISYYDNLHGWLKFASKTGASWDISTVVKPNSGEYSQMAVDSKGTAYVVYRDQNNKGVFLATRTGQTWATEAIEMGKFVGWDASIALRETAGKTLVHVAYHDFDKGSVRYAVKKNGTWTPELVDGATEDVGWFTSIQVDAAGTVHISYIANEDSSLRYASRADGASTWTLETIDKTTTIGDTQTLALDPSGHPVVAYNHDAGLQSAKPTLWYAARQDNGTWKSERVDFHGNDNGQFPSLAFDGAGKAHISYLGSKVLRHAWQDASGWKVEKVDDAGIVGQYTSMKIDSSDKVHIAYRDLDKTALKYAVQQ